MFNKIIVAALFIVFTLYGQQNSKQLLTKQEYVNNEMQMLRIHGITTKYVDNNNILVQLPDGTTLLKNIQTPEQTKADTGDLILTLDDLDTMAYHSKYKFFAELPLGDFYAPNEFAIFDANKNGRKEIYANRMRKTMGDPFSFEGFAGFELGSDSLFKQILFFPDSVSSASGFGDVEGDGLYDIALFRGRYPDSKHFIYTQPTENSYPTTVKMQYDTLGGWIGTHLRSFVDIDGEGRDELIYKVVGTDTPLFTGVPTVVAKYDSLSKEFVTVFNQGIKDPGEELTYTHGLSFGDFDGDGKMNIGTGSQNGYAYTHEYQGNNTFTTKLIAQVPTKNLYLTCVTNDFNGNGKPEVWFGGDTFFNGTAITRLFAFEAIDNDQYQKVYQIDIVGLFSFIGFGMKTRDMDNDGIDELFVHLAQRILIFKNTGSGSFILWYVKVNELAAAGLNSVIWHCDAEDIDGDEIKEIFLNSDRVISGLGSRKFTTVFKRNISTGVTQEDVSIPSDFILYQNYPNPFNNQTTIKFAIPQDHQVIIKIYNSLGKEIVELLNAPLQTGTHTVSWNGTSSNNEAVSSGVYFVLVNMQGVKKTIKAIFIK